MSTSSTASLGGWWRYCKLQIIVSSDNDFLTCLSTAGWGCYFVVRGWGWHRPGASGSQRHRGSRSSHIERQRRRGRPRHGVLEWGASQHAGEPGNPQKDAHQVCWHFKPCSPPKAVQGMGLQDSRGILLTGELGAFGHFLFNPGFLQVWHFYCRQMTRRGLACPLWCPSSTGPVVLSQSPR